MGAVERDIQVAVICDICLVRDVVVETLTANGISVTCVARRLDEIPEDYEADIVLIMEASPGNALPCHDALPALSQRFNRWLVIGTNGTGSTSHMLKQYHDSVSVAPFELHKDDIPRLVRITAHTHEVCVDGACRRFPSSAMQYLDDARLNQDQWHILRLLAAGASNKEIASALHCAEPHAKALLKRTLLTINANNRTHAAAVAARAGL